jgi:hypothetical protein
MNCGLVDKTHCRFTFPKGKGLKALMSKLSILLSPLQWTFPISPQFIRGRAWNEALVQIFYLLIIVLYVKPVFAIFFAFFSMDMDRLSFFV